MRCDADIDNSQWTHPCCKQHIQVCGEIAIKKKEKGIDFSEAEGHGTI